MDNLKLYERIYKECNTSEIEQLFEKILQNNIPNPKRVTSAIPRLSQYAKDIIWVLDNIGKSKIADNFDKNEYNNKKFFVADIGKLLQSNGIVGPYISVTYKTIYDHYLNKGKNASPIDLDHIITDDILVKICNEINRPFLIANYPDKKDLYLNIKINGHSTLIGVNVSKNKAGEIATIFGRDDIDLKGNKRPIYNVIYIDKNLQEPERGIFMDLIDPNTATPQVQVQYQNYKNNKKVP